VSWKAYLGEPADSNLQDPVLSISVYLGCICSMLVAAVLSRRLTTKRAILGNLVNESNMQRATIGCMVTGIVLTICLTVFPGGNGSVLSALAQLNQFLPLAIVLGTINSIRRSGGTKAVNLPVLLTCLFVFAQGLFGFSKQGILTPFLCWMLAAASQRYRVTKVQIASGFVLGYLIVHYLVPYSQYGRVYHEDSISANLGVVISMMSNLGQVREEYLNIVVEREDDDLYHYYNTPQGFMDRLQAFSMDDALISYKNKTSFVGIRPILEDFGNLVPHFIWKDKPVYNQGNAYAHELGLLGEEDTTTGVSFSAGAESYILLGWTSVFVLAPLLWTALFVLFDSLCGDLRRSPWGLLVAIMFAHAAPEGGLGGVIYMLGFSALGIIFAAVITAYAMPVIGTFFIGPEGILIRRAPTVRSAPGRMRPVQPSEG
jgi:hypothetical protein